MTRSLLRRSLSILLLALMCFVPSGCDDETAPRTVPFRVDVTVLGPDDRPVEGMEVRLHVPIPGFMLKSAASVRRAATVIEVKAPQRARQILEIYDLDGELVRELYDDVTDAGQYQYVFDGKNDKGVALLGTHVLDFRLTARDESTDEVLFQDRYWATLFTGIDVQQTQLLGVTDPTGRVTVTDQSLFPGLYELPDLNFVDEAGQFMGTFNFGDGALFVLHPPGTSTYSTSQHTIHEGPNEVILAWSPPPAPSDPSSETAAPKLSGPTVARRNAPIVPLEWEFPQNYPNPFN